MSHGSDYLAAKPRSLAEVLDIAAGDTVEDAALGLGLVDRLTGAAHAVVDFAAGRYCLHLTELTIVERKPRP